MTKSASVLVALALLAACNDKRATQTPDGNPNNAPQSAPDSNKPDSGKPDAGVPGRQTLETLRKADSFLVKSDFVAGDLLAACDLAIADAQSKVSALELVPAEARTFANTTLVLENVLADFDRDVGRMQFLSEVAVDEALRDEANDCSSHASTFYVNLFTRREVYNVVKVAKTANADEARLQHSYMESFESNGLKLSDDVLAQVNAKSQELAQMTNDFSENINKDKTTVALTDTELEGVPASIINGLKRDDQNRVIVPMNEALYPQLIVNAKLSDTRHKCSLAYNNRAAGPNLPLLKKILKTRQDIAKLQGFPSWADYQLSTGRMAKNVPTVMGFLNGLKDKLAIGLKRDYDGLLKFKKESDPTADHLDPWDLGYLEYQIQKRDYQLDDEKIREYFPSDKVVEAMFKVYSTLLGVRYEEVTNAQVWAPGVKMYKIFDGKSNELIGHFYTDFIPREGKFSHAAAFPLTAGRRLADGTYNKPMAVIVANLNPPADGKPSLLAHDEVETIFHEFGHIMHQTLTKAPYASLAGSAVYRDFVEAPSQMLENWVWSPEILASLSSHYLRPNERLPDDLLKQMIAARDFDSARSNTGQLYYGLMDMTYHMLPGDFDTTEVQYQLYRDVLKLEPTAGSHFEASFGHLMGYDAGYYSYLWSQVYAADMFTRFEGEGLLNPATGASYRTNILERGGMEDPLVLITKFLGREPNNKAFLKRLGIE